MRKTVITISAVLAFTIFAGSAFAQEGADMDAAIKQYLKVSSIDMLLNDAMANFIKAVPPENKAAIEETFRLVNRDRITTAMVSSMKKTFTVQEVKALTKFYASPEGKSVLKKMNAMQADLMPVIQAEVGVALQKAFDKAQKEGQKTK